MTHAPLDAALLNAMSFRCIGPPRGGRVLAVAGHPRHPATFYFGGCAGGVWRTDDGGVYWTNISDGQFGSAAVGAIAIAPSDPNVIYVGTGEATLRGDVSYGDGVYRSTDGGRSWRHVGLRESRHIAKIRIHPVNPDLVYVAALGHAFGSNAERGVFRSKDGGSSWEQVLFVSEQAGAVDLSMDPANPRILYAAIYETYRTFWTLCSGGPASGLWQSTDGGDSWQEITDRPGLPGGLKGKIGVAVSPANGSRVWALIEAEQEKAGLYRSDDHGRSWRLVSNNRDLIHRPWYYCHVFADPQDADTVYVLNLEMWKSTDGGVHWSEITTPHGDNHDLWIDPHAPQRMVQGNDGGACVTLNGGASWSSIYNQCTAQFYHLAVDNRYPYHVYGTQQDNSSIAVPSRTEKGAIPMGDCYAAGTGESGHIAVRPDDADIVYVGAIGSSPGGGGALQRYDHRTKQVRLITVWPESYLGHDPGEMLYRFAWTYPIVISPHDPNVLYVAGNRLFRSIDEGNSWTVLSPDLSRRDPAKLKASGGPLTLDTSGAETYGTIFAFAESPHAAGEFWAGSDDGLLHLSRDDGATWTLITPPDLPEWTLIGAIELSRHRPGVAYVAAIRYKLDDYRPFLFKTEDYGRSWHTISRGLPQTEITRVIREDPVRPGLLFVGTETGLFVSLDDGGAWSRFRAGLPVAPVYDLLLKESDLVVATHGRSFWIADDITPLRELQVADEVGPWLFAPRPTVRSWQGWDVNTAHGAGKQYMLDLGSAITFCEEKDENGAVKRTILDGGENPPDGVIIYYTLPTPVPTDLSLAILGDDGGLIRRFRRKQTDSPPGERTLPAQPGLNRFVWDMTYANAVTVPDDVLTAKAQIGPRAAPGRYQVQLAIGGEVQSRPFEILVDPRVTVAQTDLDAQFLLWQRICDKVSELHTAVNQLRSVRSQVTNWAARADHQAVQEKAAALTALFDQIETELIQTAAMTSNDRLRHKARLNAKLIALIGVVAAADVRPPQQVYAVFDHLAQQVDLHLMRLARLLADEIPQFVALLRDQAVPFIDLQPTQPPGERP